MTEKKTNEVPERDESLSDEALDNVTGGALRLATTDDSTRDKDHDKWCDIQSVSMP